MILLSKNLILSPLLNDYLNKFKLNESKKNCLQNYLLKNLFKKSFSYLNNENDKNELFNEYYLYIDKHHENNFYEKEINEILKDKNFIELLNEIIKSKVMKNAYINISDWYKTNGKKDLYDEINDNNDEKVKQDKSNENEEIYKYENIINKENILINKRFFISYYYKFCDILKTLDFSKIFITMTLPKTIKGFTFRFLKIILNYNGIELYTNNKFDTNELLKAYLIFVIIHEINHFIKRYFNKDVAYDLCRTPKINELDEGYFDDVQAAKQAGLRIQNKLR